jgi:hypothetical protein
MNLDELDLGGLFLDAWPHLKGTNVLLVFISSLTVTGGAVHKRLPKIPIVDLSENLFTKIPEEILQLKVFIFFPWTFFLFSCNRMLSNSISPITSWAVSLKN